MQAAGDLWYFPPGIPHSLQANEADPDGAEFLLVRFSLTAILFIRISVRSHGRVCPRFGV